MATRLTSEPTTAHTADAAAHRHDWRHGALVWQDLQSPPAAPNSDHSPDRTPQRGGRLTATLRSEPRTFNRYVSASAVTDVFNHLTQARLVRVNRATHELEPWLAESWRNEAGDTSFVLTLREGLRWSDGTPFTADDVLFSARVLYAPAVNSVLATSVRVDGRPLVFSAPDPRTVRVELPAPFGPGLRLLDNLPILPKHKLEAALDAGTFNQAWSAAAAPSDLAGLGPFQLARYEPGQRRGFERNPHYWRTAEDGTALPYLDDGALPRAMTREDMDRVRDDFVRSTRYAAEAGFDWLELHCAHGYLLSSFISPLTNQRSDEYGGSLENRLRYPLEVFAAVRAAWPQQLPMSVRISAHDWVDGGITPDDAVEIARAFKAAGADMIDCSSGQVSALQRPTYGRMYQTPFADRIRNEAGIATIAVGAISEADHVNSIIAAGRADLCAVARPHLANPAWTLTEAAKIGWTGVAWPRQYLSGKTQMETLFAREKAQQVQPTYKEPA